jgi:hypothetical protein
VRFDELPDVVFERFLGHAELAVWIEQFLIKEETVRASQIASGTSGLGQQMKGRRYPMTSGGAQCGLLLAIHEHFFREDPFPEHVATPSLYLINLFV